MSELISYPADQSAAMLQPVAAAAVSYCGNVAAVAAAAVSDSSILTATR